MLKLRMILFLVLLFLVIDGRAFSQTVTSIFNKQKSELAQKKLTATVDLVSEVKRIAKNDSDKLVLVYEWITSQLRYDWERYQRFLQGDPSALQTVINVEEIMLQKKGVCADFSHLAKNVFSDLNIPCEVINGFAKGGIEDFKKDTFNLLHSWNAVKIDDKWLLVDFTWAAITKAFGDKSDFFFASDPAKFIYTHYPYDPKWALLPYVKSLDDFLTSPIVYWNHLQNINTGLFNPVAKRNGAVISINTGFKLSENFIIECYDSEYNFLEEVDYAFKEEKSGNWLYTIQLPSTCLNSSFLSLKVVFADSKSEITEYRSVIDFYIDRPADAER